jgi:methionyl aminopeptidase
MEKSAEIISEILRTLSLAIKPGVNTLEIDKLAEEEIKRHASLSINKGYKNEEGIPFPSVVCININNIIVHGIPRDYILKDGDIIGLDMGIKFKGFAADCGMTLPVGEISPRDERLIRYAKQTLYHGIELIRPGIKVSEISREIEHFASMRGFVTNYLYGGHFIGKEMHEEPFIPNYDYINDSRSALKGIDQELKIGDVLCLEPMITYKDKFGIKDKDGWTHFTRDGRKSAFFEHMIEVTEKGYKILTTHIEL